MAAAFASSNMSRKRARPASPTKRNELAASWADISGGEAAYSTDSLQRSGDWSDAFAPEPHAFSSAPNGFAPYPFSDSHDFAPAPLASSRYLLAGGQESPSASHGAGSSLWLSHASLADVSFRRGRPYDDDRSRGLAGFAPAARHSTAALPAPLAREGNGRARAVSNVVVPQQQQDASSSVGHALYSTFSGVVGKVWSFCTAGTFRGFFAGGGRGYSMHAPDQAPDGRAAAAAAAASGADIDADAGWHDVLGASTHMPPPHSHSPATRVPGGFPQSSSPPRPETPQRETRGVDGGGSSGRGSDYFSDARATKRSRRSYAGADVYGSPGASWVLVHDSPARRGSVTASGSAASPVSGRRPSSRASLRLSHAGGASVAGGAIRSSAATAADGFGAASTRSRGASPAGLRSTPRATPRTTPRPSPAHSRHNSAPFIPTTANNASAPRHSRRQSLAPRQGESPIAAEAAKFAKDMRRAEKREDRDINRMNRTLQDMIREAKEALGTTVEVVMDDAEEEW